MKTFQTTLWVGAQAAKKYLAVMALASVASFTSLGSLALFAQDAHAEATNTESADALVHHKYHGAGDGKRGWEQERPRFGAKLDLTDAQQESLRAARAANQASQTELHEKLRSAHAALHKASAANADDALLNKLAGDLANLIAQRELARAKSHRDFLNLLTPAQKQTLASFAAETKNTAHGPRNRGKGRDQHQHQHQHQDQEQN